MSVKSQLACKKITITFAGVFTIHLDEATWSTPPAKKTIIHMIDYVI